MITVTMLAKNCERTLDDSLTALRWADEIIVLDTGSTDRTVEIARTFHNVKVESASFTGFGALHNQASALATHDWILSVDSDEIVTAELADEVQQLHLEPHTVYTIPRQNEFNERWIRACGWHPDRVTRLYNRKSTRWSDHEVHESLITEGLEVAQLRCPLRHISYTGVMDMLEKMRLYGDLWAHQYRHKRRSSLPRALLHSTFTFLSSYLLQRGLFFGYEGFLISLYKSHSTFYKYIRLRELNRN